MALGRSVGSRKGIARGQLSEGLILVMLSPEHRCSVLNYRQMICFPHLSITGFSFSSKEKEEIREKEGRRQNQKNRATCKGR